VFCALYGTVILILHRMFLPSSCYEALKLLACGYSLDLQKELDLLTAKYEAAVNLDRYIGMGSCFFFLPGLDVFLMMLCPVTISQLMHPCKLALCMLLVVLMNSVIQLT